jgi:Domain of unknown function (DUF4232)
VRVSRAIGVALLALPLLAAACGGGRHAAATTTRAATTRSVAPAPPPATTATTVATTTAPAPVPTCGTSDLSLAAAAGQAGLGHASTVFVLTNASKDACRVDGYPGMAFLSASGSVVLGTVQRGSSYLFDDPGPQPIVLRPGDKASFSLGWTRPNGRSCREAAQAEVTPPDETTHLTVSARTTICPGDSPTVSALVPGDRGVGGGAPSAQDDRRLGPDQIGLWDVAQNGTLGAATDTLGRPASTRRNGGACVLRWPKLGLVVAFAAPSAQDPCDPVSGSVRQATATGGSWHTAAGLAVGDPLATLRADYPNATQHGSTWWLLLGSSTTSGAYPALAARVGNGRVTSLQVVPPAGA